MVLLKGGKFMDKGIKILLNEIEKETGKEFRTKSIENGIIRFGNKEFELTIVNGEIYCLNDPIFSVERAVAVMLKKTIETFEINSRKYSSKEKKELAKEMAELFHKESQKLYKEAAYVSSRKYSWW
jgi:hypothetical protein